MINENKQICVSDSIMGYSPQEVETIKGVLGFKMSDSDLMIFLHICKHTKLDPLARQIYAIPRKGKMTIQTSIDGFRLIADRTGCYAPGRPSEFHYDEKGRLLAATSYVKKFAGGTWHEIGEQSLMCEYMGNTPFWSKMPAVMLSKVSEARALRRAFPADLSGLYTDDEMDQAARPSTDLPDVPQIISGDQWNALDEYLNGNVDLRDKLKKLCRVDDLKNINTTQLEACRGYAQAWREKHKEIAYDEKEKIRSTDQLESAQSSD